MKLNDADAVYVGANAADAVYLGNALVWSGGAPSFDPMTLFSGGQSGAIYDPSETSHMYQESTGQTTVANGDPVGFILDGRFGYVRGAEKVTNGDFSSGTGWVVSNGTITGGALVKSLTGGCIADQSMAGLTSGTFYEVTYDVVAFTASGTLQVTFESGSTALGVNRTITGTGSFREFISAGTGNVSLRLTLGTALLASIDNVSVKEVPGKHAFQITSTARPVYQTATDLHWLLGDGVDDYLVTNSGTAIFNGGGYMSCAFTPSASAAKGVFAEQDPDNMSRRVAMYHDTVSSGGGYPANYAPDATGRLVQYPAPISVDTRVLSFASDGTTATLRANASSIGSVASTANFPSTTRFEMLRQQSGGAYLSGKFYAGIIVDDTLDADTIAQADAWVGAKAGLSL